MHHHAVFHTYVLRNVTGLFYVGHTDDLGRRLAEHNSAGPKWGKFTRKNGPWRLVWSEPHTTRVKAMAREREIKSWKSARTIRERLLGN